MATLNALPEELQLLIIDFLDVPSPSSQKLRQEPALELTKSDDHTLKNVSLLSKCWRRLVLPVLFKYARLRLDASPKYEWTTCKACNTRAISNPTSVIDAEPEVDGVDQYHVDMVRAALARCNVNLKAGLLDDEAQQMGEMAFALKERIQPSTALSWIPRFYHGLQDFIRYLIQHELTSVVDSFVLYTGPMLEQKLRRFPHEAADRDWRYAASAAFWAHLLSIIDPSTITILAPPTDLACLANCAIDTFGDWAFTDMEYHILSLTQPNPTSNQPPRTSPSQPPSYSTLRPIPPTYPSASASSILALRPWTHLSLNEGSFLKAYGTYEFFERGPPSLIASIKQSTLHPASRLPALASLSYTAIFPFATHADFAALLPRIGKLSLQLAPRRESTILHERARLGKADLADCWTELAAAYAGLAGALASVRRVGVGGLEGGDVVWDTRMAGVRVRELEVLDLWTPGMRGELDEIFTPLCLPVWVERLEGVYERMGGG